ncbi:MAG: DNA-processing protein DprA [Rickettsiales bacterium]|jgi:DNA processing protein|nr:DNA-processing protein DprA [Rickettsiales bacterium]
MTFIPHPTLRGSNPIDVLRLIRSEQVGPATFFHLVKFCGSVANALTMAPEMSRRGGRAKPIRIASAADAEREYAAIRNFGAEVILYGEENYPRLLQIVTDAPPLLTVKGHPHLWNHDKIIGMVGARNASANGCAFARKLAIEFGEAGYLVVSGLARGIDAAAHRGALAKGTVAVIGGGINNVYPPENAVLFEEIAATGAIISEMPFGANPHARSFPGRNRIIAGMSRAVAVIEASLKSGSLITANFACEYGRDVFAVPGSPMDPRCQGTNHLIREGAGMLESARDVLGNLAPLERLPLAEPEIGNFAESAMASDSSLLDSARKVMTAALGPSPTLLEDVMAATELPPHLVMVVLLELELAGRLQRHPGGRVSLVSGEDVHYG